MSHATIKPIIFWEGFPVCGLLLKGVVEKYGNEMVIVATRPRVPFVGLEKMLGKKIVWLDDPNDIWMRRNEFEDRNFIVHTGWRYKSWRKYDAFIRQRNDAKIVAVVDNRYRGDLRQWVGALWFRIFLQRYFDAAFVPGREGQKLMRFLGMNPSRIYTGNYGAYEGIYNETRLIQERGREFMFVGQLHQRKSVDVLLEAFKAYRRSGGTWELRLLGDGPLRYLCDVEGVICDGFLQPEEVAKKMNNARVFILPSRDDNWGTVVCEAAACGMHLLTTRTVGSSIDMVRENVNGKVLNTVSVQEIKEAFWYFESMGETLLVNGSEVSKGIARGYDSNAYYSAFNTMVTELFD